MSHLQVPTQRPMFRRQTTQERRQKSLTAFKSSESLQKLKEQAGTLNAAVEVSITFYFLLFMTNVM
ncbi:hypothetical protein P3342_002708 [Pyrenophora teres f. teres]|nr:hypothetical protein P3342_002708 [Pyrenophora teres f. teres]